MKAKFSLPTLCVHRAAREIGQSVIPPIDLGTVHDQQDAVGYDEIYYPRFGTLPIQTALNTKLALLEGAEAAVATSSGVTAVSAALLANLEHGDHVIASSHLYGGTLEILSSLAKFGVRVTLLDEFNAKTIEAAIHLRTKIIFTEAISNPLTRVVDHLAVVKQGRQRGLTTIIDNTFATPMRFRPLELGYDVVVHSASKFLSGHSDLVAGAIMGSSDIVQKTHLHLRTHGGLLDPMSCHFLDRGLKTLCLRTRQQSANAAVLSKRLAALGEVRNVWFPGLAHHPDHAIAQELFADSGSMMAIEFHKAEDAARLVRGVHLFIHSASLGGVESLVSIPANTSHHSASGRPSESDNLLGRVVRLSAGIECVEDLWWDLEQAITSPASSPER